MKSIKLHSWIITDRYAPNGVIVERVSRKGYVSAIRYAPGMTCEEVRADLVLNPPVKSDWRPFNQSSGSFV